MRCAAYFSQSNQIITFLYDIIKAFRLKNLHQVTTSMNNKIVYTHVYTENKKALQVNDLQGLLCPGMESNHHDR